jgi:pantoate kinase
MTTTGGAFSPCQITGFFKIHDSAENLLKVGSTGAGINLRHGVTTSVRVGQSSRAKFKILFNGKPLPNPVVSLAVIREHLERSSRKLRVTVSHESLLPMGCGYGTSGAGALSLSLALNEATGSDLTQIEAAQIAHKAEVKNRTGLGTVTSAFFGGLLLRTRPGAPGFAEFTKITPSSSLRVVSGSFGPISTRGILSSPGLRKRIDHCGKGLVPLQLRNPETGTFLKLSQRFAECLGIISPRLLETIYMMQRRGIVSSMMMIGESIFTVVRRGLVPEARAVLREVGLTPIVSRISERGASVL